MNRNRISHLAIIALLCVWGIAGCAPFAPPSPLVTFGGPETVAPFRTEVGMAVGTGWALFPNAHSGGHGWFGRYKRGLADEFDIGVDALGVVRSNKGTFTAKLVGRYLARENVRLEGGIGLADDSDGKSLNGDVAMTWGTRTPDPWNYYASARLGAAKGYPGDIFGSGDQTPADALFPIVNLGAQGRISETERFIFEGGFGYIISRGLSSAPLIYLACGILFQL